MIYRLREKRLWRDARTLEDVGELVALWLEGKISYYPGYSTRYRPEPDEETQEITKELAAANRAGYVTCGSQPGWENRQRAAVEGFAHAATAAKLARAADRAGLIVVGPAKPPRFRCDYSHAVPAMQYSAGHATDTFGTILSRSDVGFLVLSKESHKALFNARQVTIVDPVWGRNSVLWPLLTKFARQSRRRQP